MESKSEIKIQKNYALTGVDIFNVEFKVNGKLNAESKINLKFDAAVYYPPENGNQIKIILQASIESVDVFKLEVSSIGNFETKEEANLEEKREFVNKNAAAIIFPFLRSYISILTSNSGSMLPHILLPIHFFKGPLREISIPPTEFKKEKSEKIHAE